MTLQAQTQFGHSNKRVSQLGRDVLILGLGNILYGDEGFGAYAAQEMEKMDLPENVEVIDAGTSSLDVLLSSEDINKLIVVDVLKTDSEPGTIYKIKFSGNEREKLSNLFCENQRTAVSLHQVGLLGALAAAEKLGNLPDEIVILGIEPEKISFGVGVTDILRGKLEEIINLVLEEISDAVHGK
ncbi:MAG: hydrogenase maturation protease [Planctomycetota bacterium]|jgi:hydrogenase maturation protease